MPRNLFPHKVTIQLPIDQGLELLNWLRTQGHEVRKTMCFGESGHRQGESFTTQVVRFNVKEDAMLFKLTWGGV
jgi:hypothetical protein